MTIRPNPLKRYYCDEMSLIILVVGNSGIGFETTKQLALHNARVYIASRSQERVQKAIDEMSQSANTKHLDLHFLQIDLLDLKSIKEAVAKFSAREERLDILINNAGVRYIRIFGGRSSITDSLIRS